MHVHVDHMYVTCMYMHMYTPAHTVRLVVKCLILQQQQNQQ